MNDDPLAVIGAEIGQAVRATTAAVMHGLTTTAHLSEQRAKRRRVELVQHRKAIQSATEAARLAASPDDEAKRWLSAITNAGGESLASDVWHSDAWGALAEELRKHGTEGHDVAKAIAEVIPQRDFDDKRDSAAILHWRITQHFGDRAGEAAVERAAKSTVADNWQWTADDMLITKPTQSSQRPKGPQTGQYRPRSYNMNRPPDVER